jgi:uncharacterized protein (DUF924 family)
MSASPIATMGYSDVLAFWFGEHGDDAQAIAQNNARWWQANARFDAEIRARFAVLRDEAIAGELDDWLHTPRGRLALIVLVDQFSRNLFRNDARAFEHDALARHWCEDGLKITADDALRPIERVFFYMPLQHSESIADQDLAVTLFRLLRDSVPEPQREAFANYLRHAERHRGVIARFGRFPHRNVALRRESTAEELKFLEQPGSSF